MSLFNLMDKSLVAWRFFIKDKIILISLILSIVLNITNWIVLFYKMPRGADLLPLHYNIYFGVDKFGPWYHSFFMPATGFLFMLLNFLVGYFIYKNYKFLSDFLAVSSTVLQLILLSASIIIILINV